MKWKRKKNEKEKGIISTSSFKRKLEMKFGMKLEEMSYLKGYLYKMAGSILRWFLLFCPKNKHDENE